VSEPLHITLTQGRSDDAILRAAAAVVTRRRPGTVELLLDLGCGQGQLRPHVAGLCARYVGVDLSRHGGTWAEGEFVEADLSRPLPFPDGAADVVVSVETVEHLENPRALLREATRVLRPGGLLVVTTPNQESLLSLASLLWHGEFSAFREAPGLYPSHVSALLGVDLRRMAAECGLRDVELSYTDHGRVPGTARHWPRGLTGRRFSDNVVLSARR
jgi:SAM-dependent methyltransferase